MFGLFKKNPSNNSPEENLRKDMKIKIGNMTLLLFENSPLRGTAIMEGLAMMDAISQAENFYFKRSIAVSEDYGVSREDTVTIIKQTARSVFKEFTE